MSTTKPATMRSMDRGMRILELLAERPMRAKEIAQATGSPWTTAHRTLSYLREQGFVRRDDASGLHYVGRRLFHMGVSYLHDHPLLRSSRPLLRTVSDRTGGFVQIAERDGRLSIGVASVEPRSPDPSLIAAGAMLGHRSPLHTGARGHVLLAYSDPEFIEEYLAGDLVALTKFSITDPKELRERLNETREHGYAVTAQDVSMLGISAAAPIRSAEGEVIAAAAIIHYYEDRELAAESPRAAVELARTISHSLGWGLH